MLLGLSDPSATEQVTSTAISEGPAGTRKQSPSPTQNLLPLHLISSSACGRGYEPTILPAASLWR